jgi:IS1 family transposase
VPEGGERWGCLSQDRASRFVVAWAAGPRTAALAEAVVGRTRARTAGQAGLPWITDGWAAYAETIWDAYADPIPAPAGREGWSVLKLTPGVALTQAVKHRKGRRLARIEVRAPLGPPAAQPYTVHIERLNGVLRDRLACLTRKTHAFAKQPRTWDAALGLALFEHNWIRPHPALRQLRSEPVDAHRYQPRTPAMGLGLATEPLPWLEFLTQPLTHYMRG